MGLFDGILICSDWDGTLYCNGTVPEGTKKAIEYFISEGGYFSITSGRAPEFLNEHKHFVKPNTYCICYGGSLICDIESGEVLREGYLDAGVVEIIDRMLCADIEIDRINVSTPEGVRHYTPIEYFEYGKGEIVLYHNYKITFNCATSEDGDRLKELCDSFESEDYTFARSFDSYLEIMKTEYTKGNSARLLKKKLGARLLVGMGDYENDIPLFAGCDVSFAVANAVKPLKDISTYVTKATVSESAANEIVDRLEKLILADEI